MSRGVVFDIRELTVHDGPGLRTTVFMKGCPLRCQWCHNPESQAFQTQIMRSPVGERICGVEYSDVELADRLNRYAPLLANGVGGITFSGGEPLAQSAFVADVIDRLVGLDITLDTCGFAGPDDFERLARRVNRVYFDLKLIDAEMHRRFTGVDNAPILANLRRLSELGTPFHIRVPLVPAVTDTDQNLIQIRSVIAGLRGLICVDLLSYNKAAGGKYACIDRDFSPTYDESRPLNIRPDIFSDAGIEVHIA